MAKVVANSDGYLKQNGFTKTYGCFMKECPHLIEYCRLLSAGRELQTTMMGLSLLLILDEWAQLKQNGSLQTTPSDNHHVVVKSGDAKVHSKGFHTRQPTVSPRKIVSPKTSRCDKLPASSRNKPSIPRLIYTSTEHLNETAESADSDADSVMNVEADFVVNVTSLTDLTQTPLSCRGDNMAKRRSVHLDTSNEEAQTWDNYFSNTVIRQPSKTGTNKITNTNSTDIARGAESPVKNIHTKSPRKPSITTRHSKSETLVKQTLTKLPRNISHVHFMDDSEGTVNRTHQNISQLKVCNTEKENDYPTLKGLLNISDPISPAKVSLVLGAGHSSLTDTLHNNTEREAGSSLVGKITVEKTITEESSTSYVHVAETALNTNSIPKEKEVTVENPHNLGTDIDSICDRNASQKSNKCDNKNGEQITVSNSVTKQDNANKMTELQNDKSKHEQTKSKTVETSQTNADITVDQPQVETVDSRNKCLSWISNSSNHNSGGGEGGDTGAGDGSGKQSPSEVTSGLGNQAEQESTSTSEFCSTSRSSDGTDKTDATIKKANANATPVIPKQVTPSKKIVAASSANNLVTPVKLFQTNDLTTSKSPRRKKPKTPKKRTSEVVSPASNVSDPLPIFQQILSDTRLHEKLAATCNLLSCQLKLNHSGNEKEATKEEASKCVPDCHAEDLVVTASKSLEEILDMDTNFATDLMSENIDMSDPAFESLFKLFGTDKESFSENLRREKTTEEMTKEVEELEKSLHEMATFINSPREEYSPPHPVPPGSQDLFTSQPVCNMFNSPQHTAPSFVPQHSQPCSSNASSCGQSHMVSFTPLLRENELGSSPLHSTPSQCSSQHNPSYPQSEHVVTSPGSTATQPFSPAMSDYPSTPYSHQAFTPLRTQPFSPINHNMQPESPYGNQEVPNTPKQSLQGPDQADTNVPSTPVGSMSSTFVFSQEPSTPSQASTADYNTTTQGFHQSTPVQPKNKQLLNGHIPANCSPLVKADLHVGSPVMVQKNGPYTPQAKKSIFPPSGTNHLLFSPSQHLSHILPSQKNIQENGNDFGHQDTQEMNPLSPIMPASMASQQTVSFMAMVNNIHTQDGSTNIPGNGRMVSMFTGTEHMVENNLCSTIENTIGCISLPQPQANSVTEKQAGSKTKTKRGGKKEKAVTTSALLASFTTLKGLLAKPLPPQVAAASQTTLEHTLSMPELVAPGSPDHVQLTEMDIQNQNICILSPGGSTSIKIPLLGCQDALNEPSESEDAHTVSLWEQDLNSSVQYAILPENQVTQPLVNSIAWGNAVDILNQIKNTDNSNKAESSRNSRKNPRTGKRKYTRKKKVEEKNGYFRSPSSTTSESANAETNAVYTATPINFLDKVYVRQLNFGPNAEDMPQFKKIAPKPSLQSGSTVIIVNNGPVIAQTDKNHGMAVLHSDVNQGQPLSLVISDSVKATRSCSISPESESKGSDMSSSTEKSGASSCVSENDFEGVQYMGDKIKSKKTEMKPPTKPKKYPIEPISRQTKMSSKIEQTVESKKNSPGNTEATAKTVSNDNSIGLVASIDLTSDGESQSVADCIQNTRPKRYPIRDMKNVLKKVLDKKSSHQIQPKISDLMKPVTKSGSSSTEAMNDKSGEKADNMKAEVLMDNKNKDSKLESNRNKIIKADGKSKSNTRKKIDKPKAGMHASSVVVLEDSNDSTVMCVTSPETENKELDKKLKVKLKNKKNSCKPQKEDTGKLKLTVNFNRKKNSGKEKDSSSSDDEIPLSKVRQRIRDTDVYSIQEDRKTDLVRKGATDIEIPATSVSLTPKKTVGDSPSNVFTPSKEDVLEMVGLTPTKSLNANVSFRSPDRANPLDVLAEWQNSSLSGRKRCLTPNAKNSVSRVDSPFKSPTTPKRKTPAKRLFGSPQQKSNVASPRNKSSVREMKCMEVEGKINGVVQTDKQKTPAKQLFKANTDNSVYEKDEAKKKDKDATINKCSVVLQNMHVVTESEKMQRVRNRESLCSQTERENAITPCNTERISTNEGKYTLNKKYVEVSSTILDNEKEKIISVIDADKPGDKCFVNETVAKTMIFEKARKKEKKKKHKDKKMSESRDCEDNADKHDETIEKALLKTTAQNKETKNTSEHGLQSKNHLGDIHVVQGENASERTEKFTVSVNSHIYPIEANVILKNTPFCDVNQSSTAENVNSISNRIGKNGGNKTIPSRPSKQDIAIREDIVPEVNDKEYSFEENRPSAGNISVSKETPAIKNLPDNILNDVELLTASESVRNKVTAEKRLEEGTPSGTFNDTCTRLEMSKNVSIDGTTSDHSHRHHHHRHHGKKKKSKKRHRQEDDTEDKEKHESKRRKHKHKKSRKSLESLSSLAIETALSQLHNSTVGSTPGQNPASVGSLSPSNTS